MRILAPHLVILTLFAGYVAYWQLPPPIRTSREEHAKLKYGMTPREAEAILGGPPGDYSSDHVSEKIDFPSVTGEVLPDGWGLWATDEGCIRTSYYSGRASGFTFIEVHRRPWVFRHIAVLLVVLVHVVGVAILQYIRRRLPQVPHNMYTWQES